jgi:hypothetical protein
MGSYGVVPFAWTRITNVWSAVPLLALQEEVKRLNVNPHDIEGVTAVWRAMNVRARQEAEYLLRRSAEREAAAKLDNQQRGVLADTFPSIRTLLKKGIDG